MKTLIITVAGTGSRFNRDLVTPCLKCLYNEGDLKKSLLFRTLSLSSEFDQIIIVGGYLFDELQSAIQVLDKTLLKKIRLVYNEHYSDFGSGYSLYLGIKAALDENTTEIVFAEGDLAFDEKSWSSILRSEKDVITINFNPIYSSTAVVVYVSQNHHLQYLYDLNHNHLEIKEPFRAVFNSGQIWKFRDTVFMKEIILNLDEITLKGTNLEIIQRYFSDKKLEDIAVIGIEKWFNCNTISDYQTLDYVLLNGV